MSNKLIKNASKLLSTATLLVAFTNAQAQYPPNTQVSFVRTWDAVAPVQDPNALITKPVKDVKQATQYLDGLGRPIQTVVKQGIYPSSDMQHSKCELAYLGGKQQLGISN